LSGKAFSDNKHLEASQLSHRTLTWRC